VAPAGPPTNRRPSLRRAWERPSLRRASAETSGEDQQKGQLKSPYRFI